MKKNAGFTLIEIMIVVVILGILAAIVLPRFTNRTKQAQIAAASAQVPVRGPLSLPEIASMAQQGISDPVIISQIRTTRSLRR